MGKTAIRNDPKERAEVANPKEKKLRLETNSSRATAHSIKRCVAIGAIRHAIASAILRVKTTKATNM